MIGDPNYAEAQGALAFMYIDEDRKKYNVRVGYDPMARARKHALRAWELNPRSTIAGQALFTFYGRIKDFDNFLIIGQSAVENSPENPSTGFRNVKVPELSQTTNPIWPTSLAVGNVASRRKTAERSQENFRAMADGASPCWTMASFMSCSGMARASAW